MCSSDLARNRGAVDHGSGVIVLSVIVLTCIAPSCGVWIFAGSGAGGHRGNPGCCAGQFLRIGQPGLLAAGAADRAARLAKGCQINGVGCRTMGADNVHGVIRQMTLAAVYKTSVNESETITDAQAIDRRFGHQTGGSGFRSAGAGSDEVESGSPARTCAKSETRAFFVHMGSPSGPIWTENALVAAELAVAVVHNIDRS